MNNNPKKLRNQPIENRQNTGKSDMEEQKGAMVPGRTVNRLHSHCMGIQRRVIVKIIQSS
jgi:hypothetical protein